jgi:ubiquinone/menaquinone biosynthesis C-methylase UbiE
MPSENPYNAAVAAKYDQLRSWSGAIPRRMVEICGLKPKMQFLDLGCGTGNLLSALQAESGANAAGMDLSREMLAVASAKMTQGQLSRLGFLVQGDVARLPFADGSFDAVAGSFFLHHIPAGCRHDVFEEAYRVLSHGAFAMVTRSHAQLAATAITRYFPEVIQIDQDRFPDIPEIMGWLGETGFIDIATETIFGRETRIDDDFLKWLGEKPISTLDLLPDAQFRAGMDRARREVEKTKGDLVLRGEFSLVYGWRN